MKPTFLLPCLALALTAPLATLAAEPTERIKPEDIRPERELLITAPIIVDSDRAKYPGPWSFGTLIEELVGKEQAPEAIHQWLECYYWNSRVGQPMPQTLGVSLIGAIPRTTMGNCIISPSSSQSLTSLIPGRPDVAQKFIRSWQERDGYDAKSGQRWKPNLANAPFRLLAIVNRMDLAAPNMVDLRSEVEGLWKLKGKEQEFKRLVNFATNGTPFENADTPSGGGGYNGFIEDVTTNQEPNFGEGRLIFGAVDSKGQPMEGGWTLIFEYKLQALDKAHAVRVAKKAKGGTPVVDASKLSAREWAKAWHWLGGLELTDPRYADELERITRAFTHRRSESEGAPDSLPPTFGQLRSSEAAFGPGREFRQFNLRQGQFIPAALPLTPAPQYTEDTHDGGRALASLLHQIEPLILQGIHSLPPALPDGGAIRPLLAGHALIPEGDKEFFWEPKPRISRDARRIFSMSTCNGCHAADTGCADGLHVHPRAAGMPSATSTFLRMDGKTNQFQDPGLKSSMIKQQEMADRAAILAALLEPRDNKRLDALTDLLRERLRRAH